MPRSSIRPNRYAGKTTTFTQLSRTIGTGVVFDNFPTESPARNAFFPPPPPSNVEAIKMERRFLQMQSTKRNQITHGYPVRNERPFGLDTFPKRGKKVVFQLCNCVKRTVSGIVRCREKPAGKSFPINENMQYVDNCSSNAVAS